MKLYLLIVLTLAGCTQPTVYHPEWSGCWEVHAGAAWEVGLVEASEDRFTLLEQTFTDPVYELNTVRLRWDTTVGRTHLTLSYVLTMTNDTTVTGWRTLEARSGQPCDTAYRDRCTWYRRSCNKRSDI